MNKKTVLFCFFAFTTSTVFAGTPHESSPDDPALAYLSKKRPAKPLSREEVARILADKPEKPSKPEPEEDAEAAAGDEKTENEKIREEATEEEKVEEPSAPRQETAEMSESPADNPVEES